MKNIEIYGKSLRTIFGKHIDKSAQIVTDDWKGYRPIKDFKIKQISSNKGKIFLTLQTMIASPVRAKLSGHQVKSWLRTTYSWVLNSSINKYLIKYFVIRDHLYIFSYLCIYYFIAAFQILPNVSNRYFCFRINFF